MKKMLFLSLMIISQICVGRAALAQFSFNCIDQLNRTAARMALSSESHTTSSTQRVCNGGVGDPMVCQDVPFEEEKKMLSVIFVGSPTKANTQFMVGRTTWGGAASEPWDYFKGAGKLQLGQEGYIVSLSYSGWPSPYQYVLTIVATNTKSSNLVKRLNCGKAF
jgi:hypothetical protein